MNILIQGRLAAAEPAGPGSVAGEAGAAFAMAVGEAAASQGGPVILKEGGGEENPKEKEKESRPDASLSLMGISTLMMQGAHLVKKAPDAAADVQVLPARREQAPEEGLPVNGPMASAAGSIAGSAMNGLAPEGAFAKADAPQGQDALRPGTALDPKTMTMAEEAKTEAAVLRPVTARQTAKGKDELERADFQNIQRLQEQPAAKAAQPVFDHSAREILNPASGLSEGGMEAVREQAPANAQGREKEKTLRAPVAAVTAAFQAEKAVHTESMAATQDMAPENATREENAAMQVARASVHALKRGMTEYRVRLKPEGLGEVEVTVVTKGRAVSLSMRTDNEAARGLILGHADELRAELSAQEYQVNGLTVEVGMDNGSGAGFFASGEHAEPSFGQERAMKEQSAVPSPAAGHTAEAIRYMPRNSTINYRI